MTEPHDADRLRSVLNAALNLLSARVDHMATIEEWAALARAVAACQGTKTSAYLTEQDLEQAARYEPDWDPERDGPLPEIEPD